MTRGPALLRSVVMALHWSALVVVAGWLAGVLPAWLLALHASAWAAVTAIWGLRGGPSPALRGPVRRAAHLSHAALLALHLTGATMALAGSDAAMPVLLLVLAASALHAVWNGWRAAVLGDGAFRRMLPRALW